MLKFLEQAAEAYYKGNPIITDAEFDILAKSFGFNHVGYREEGGDKIPYPIFSLQDIFEGERLPLQEYNLVSSPKLDGAAVVLIYIQGALTSILTRGNGIVGKNVSHLIPAFPAPKTISENELIQVVGELVAPKTIEKARNYAAGALGLKSVEDFASRDLHFVAYDKYSASRKPTYSENLKTLKPLGFKTVLDSGLGIFPQDGIVYRVDSFEEFEKLGYTSHHPRGAFAFKKKEEEVVTTLESVIWQVGKSGQVSPIAILEPVKIGGVIVSRATLHNIKYIESLDLEIGCKVRVIRAGEVIPRIVGRA